MFRTLLSAFAVTGLTAILASTSALAAANYFGPGRTVVNAVIVGVEHELVVDCQVPHVADHNFLTGESTMHIPCYDGMGGVLAYIDVDRQEGALGTGGTVTFRKVSVRYTRGCHDCSMDPV